MSDYSDNVTGLMQRLTTNSSGSSAGTARRGVPRDSIPSVPSITNIDSLLQDIYLRYIAFNDEDFEKYYSVIDEIFLQLHNAMKEVDPYYNKYSSTVQFAGSHPDRLRINKPDEFDIDIVIGLPLSIKNNPLNPAESDFIIEPKDPGFVQLKVGTQFDRLPERDGSEWYINKAAYEWKDDQNFLLRSKFMDWFKSVVNRALNKFVTKRKRQRRGGGGGRGFAGGGAPRAPAGAASSPKPPPLPKFYVEGVPYIVKKSESGPAMTMYIENRDKKFKLDVDLVPALRFPIDRWPINNNYRPVPPVCAGKDYWLVVPKPNKSGHTEQDRNRSWRVALHEQEAMLMHDNNNMKQPIRFPYFWNKNNNLIGGVDRAILNQYANKVEKLLAILDNPSEYRQVAKYLLTATEFNEYNRFLNI